MAGGDKAEAHWFLEIMSFALAKETPFALKTHLFPHIQ